MIFRGLCYFAAVLQILISSQRVSAHNPPEEYYGRKIVISMEPGGLRLRYHLELSQISLFSAKKNDDRIDTSNVKGRDGLEKACMDRYKVLIPDKIVATLNGKLLNWIVEKDWIGESQDGSSLFNITLRADWKLQPGDNRLELSDAAFPDVPGPYRMSFDTARAMDVSDQEEPREWNNPKGSDPIKDHKAMALFRLSADATGASLELAPLAEEPAPRQLSLIERLWHNDLSALLSTNYGLWLLMAIALVHGAVHSVMPGHGKTMVAAYLVGERGTPWHAVLLGIVTTLAHTSAAIIIALLVYFVIPSESKDSVNRGLMFTGGLVIAGLGIWLFLQRLAGRSDHVHLFDGGLGHSHGSAPSAPPPPANTLRLVLLGIAGGIIPCWGAIVWVIGCIATGQFTLALPVVLAFSVGLSSVLIAIGLMVVYATRYGRTTSNPTIRRIFNDRVMRTLPIVGAVMVAVIGFWLCASSGLTVR